MSIFSSNKETKPEPVKRPSAPAPTPSAPAPSYNPTPASSPSRPMSGSTVISSGTQVDGNMKVEGDIQINGLIKGTLSSKGKVVVGPSGTIEGDVICKHAEISGKVNGKLKIADILFLKASAKIDGDIQTGKLVMENGVQFNGNCSMGSAATVPTSSPKPTPTTTSSSSMSSGSSSASSSHKPLNG